VEEEAVMPDPVVPTLNLAVLQGHLSRAPEEVALASGDLLVRYEVTVPRADERADTVPVVAVSPPAHARGLDAGTEVVVVGRTRRRFWSAGGATRSQVEVLARAVVPARRRAGATRALGQALATLEAFAHQEE
jgi:single-strand DNA-binding protein